MSNLKLFTFAFIYTLFTGILVQFIVLPYIFPQAHYGEGLVAHLLEVKLVWKKR